MGKLQNEDFKTEAEITGAGGSSSQLLNDSKIYVTANSINKTLSQAIIDNNISGGSSGYSVTSSKTANYTAVAGQYVPCNASGGAFTITLPTAASISGSSIKVQKTDSSSNDVTINTTSSQTVGGRDSGDIKLYEQGDYLEVISDGSNWLIMTKQETQYISSSGSETFSNIGSAGNYGLLATSAALTYGKWEVEGQFMLLVSTGTAPALISGSGFFAADGANSASTPTALTGVISGTTTWSDFSSAVSVQGTEVNSRFPSSSNKIVISITSNQTVYLVPQIDYSATGGATVYAVLKAKRIW